MSDELARLRADLEAINRVENIMAPFSYEYGKEFYDKREKIRDKIARLEAEAADPWRENYKAIEKWRKMDDGGLAWEPERKAVALVDHLTAENADLRKKHDLANAMIKAVTDRLNEGRVERDRLAARVAELENEPEPAKVALKRAEDVKVGDVILAGGKMRTVTRTRQQPRQWRIECNEWAGWFANREIVAVINEHSDPDDPILDPARVLATTAKIMRERNASTGKTVVFDVEEFLMLCVACSKDKHYRMKGDKDA